MEHLGRTRKILLLRAFHFYSLSPSLSVAYEQKQLVQREKRKKKRTYVGTDGKRKVSWTTKGKKRKLPNLETLGDGSTVFSRFVSKYGFACAYLTPSFYFLLSTFYNNHFYQMSDVVKFITPTWARRLSTAEYTSFFLARFP